ncbi:hypothetical protein JDV02_007882 [Purpureocillium takamizusanense]|uniref:SAP domain-containing protein n=1 Tax=Purpureocillium takamizusanense TaxID=2060973 RepID=A0A9Q8QJ33_9HYPO|nr:uncharacterized protein JDV02_007882 [Purpureocillium takamizusanense]UNI21939.1 hypothetical protein JDV02_007882 [Purpureocillium takamizusanense]
MAAWATFKVVDLKAELKRRGLPQGGLKAELVARLEAADQEAASPTEPAHPDDAGHLSHELDAQNEDARELEAVQKEPENTPQQTDDQPIEAAIPPPTPISEPDPVVASGEALRDTEEEANQKPDHESYEMHGALAPESSVPLSDTAAASSLSPGVDAPMNDWVPEGNAEDLKRKRRSESPTPKEMDAKRKRAQDVAHDGDQPSVADPDASFPEKTHAQPSLDNENVAASDGGVNDEASSEASQPNVAPSMHANTRAIYINNLMRPMRETDLHDHLLNLEQPAGGQRNDDAISSLYVDSIRTHAFVVFESASSAGRVRRRLHGRVWPLESNRKALFVDFVPEGKVDGWIQTEQDGNNRRQVGQRWEVVYERVGDALTAEAFLRSTSVTGSSSATHGVRAQPPQAQQAQQAPQQAPQGVVGAPTGPRGHRPPNAHPNTQHPPPNAGPAPGPSPYNGGNRTIEQPWVSFREVPPSLADRRLDCMLRYLDFDVHLGPDREINRYSFQGGDVFVDRGRENFAGIRPPHRQQAMDRSRGGRGGGRGRGRGRGAPRGGPYGFGRDRYVPY